MTFGLQGVQQVVVSRVAVQGLGEHVSKTFLIVMEALRLENIDFFMESADVRYLRTSFVKTNECVNIVQKHFP